MIILKFISYFKEYKSDTYETLRISLQVILEVTILSLLCFSTNDVVFKITIKLVIYYY